MYTIIIPIIILLGLVLTSTIFSEGSEGRKISNPEALDLTNTRKENFQIN